MLIRSRELKGKGNFYRRVKGVIPERPQAQCQRFPRGFVRNFYLHILFEWRLAQHNGGQSVTFRNMLINQIPHQKRNRRERAQAEKTEGKFLFSLPCFTHFSLCSLRMNIRTSLNHRKFIFPVLRNYLSREFRSFSSRDITGN